jgi:pimeloyl-ACP methyl ester carboxylesterase
MPTLEINGNLLFYEERGTGLPLIFIHPPLVTHFTFQRQMEQLSQDYRVICFDIRGHGKSSASEQPITYPLIVQEVLHLIDHLRLKKVILCGYSTGGSIVLEAMFTAQEWFAGGIIISGMSEVSDHLLRNQIALVITLMKLKMMPLLAARTVFTNSDTLDLYWKHLKDCIRGNAQNIEQYYRYSLDYYCTDQLHHIKAPILVVYGSKDKVFQRYAKILHDELPHNMMWMIQDVDHRIPIKKTVDLHNIIKGWIADMETKDPKEDWGRFYWNHLVEVDERGGHFV